MAEIDGKAAMLAALRITAQQREHNNLVRRLVFKARDLSIGISKCESPEEMARCFNYIQKDAEELGRFVTELQSEVPPEAKNV